VKNWSSVGSSGCQRVIADHLGDNSRFSDRKSVPLRQRPQLLQREPPAATGMGYQNAGPQALGAWRLTGFLSALPAAWARTTQRLGAFVGDRRPPVWIPRTYDCRDP
jgi:hypothetical protein